MFTVIKVGGTNGSGKSTLIRAILNVVADEVKPFKSPTVRKAVAGYKGKYGASDIYVLGSYETACGGMDTISDKEERLALLRETCKARRLIVYEGLITGKTYGAMGALSEEHLATKRGRWVYAFMDTPFEKCVERVVQRREERGNFSPFDPERTVRSTFNSVANLRAKLEAGTLPEDPSLPRHTVHIVDHKEAPNTAARKLLASLHGGSK